MKLYPLNVKIYKPGFAYYYVLNIAINSYKSTFFLLESENFHVELNEINFLAWNTAHMTGRKLYITIATHMGI